MKAKPDRSSHVPIHSSTAFLVLILLANALGLGILRFAPWGIDTGSLWPWVLLLGVDLFAIAVVLYVGEHIKGHYLALSRIYHEVRYLIANGGHVQGRWQFEEESDQETGRLRDAVFEAIAAASARAQSGDDILAGVLATLPLGVVVISERGLISLTNAPAREVLGRRAAAPGTSIYAALERGELENAIARAKASVHPLQIPLALVGGNRVDAEISDLGENKGQVLVILDAMNRAATPRPDDSGVLADLALHNTAPPLVRSREDTPLNAIDTIVVDAETTGLDVTRDRILSLGAVRTHGFAVIGAEVMDVLVQPGVAVPPRSTAVHGITDEMLRDAPDLASVLNEFFAFTADAVLVGHNVAFDLAILRHEIARLGEDWTPPVSLDTLNLASRLLPDVKDLSLDGVAATLGVSLSGRHTALGDASATAEIFTRLLSMAEARGIANLGQLIAFCQGAKAIIKRQNKAGWFEAPRN